MCRSLSAFVFLVVAGCSDCEFKLTGPSITANRAEIERALSNAVKQKFDLVASQVRCPGSGAKITTTTGSFTCIVVVDDVEVPYGVTVDVKNQSANWKPEKTVVSNAELEALVASKQKQSDREPTVTCPGPKVRLSDPEQDIQCEVVVGEARGGLLVHWKNTTGDFIMTPVAAGGIGSP